jgi:nitrate/nitrite transport system substrate-binding protein
LKIGFIPLSDCTVLAVAQEKGFFRRHGVEVALSREASWANVRDKVATGALDAAQMLAGMPLAAAAGIDPLSEAMITALSLNLNGNAVSVSNRLWERMVGAHPQILTEQPCTATALRRVIDADKSQGGRPLRFAMVYPFSTHNYELRYWLAAAGIDPDNDLQLSVVPPPRMVEMLQRGAIDGFCVGEPWGSQAVHAGLGRILITKYEIWNNSPEKVFAVKRAFPERHPEIHRAVLRALIEAAAWADAAENREEVARILAGERYVGAPLAILAAPLAGGVARGCGEPPVSMPDFHVFHRYAASFPWVSHALWLLAQMLRWRQLARPVSLVATARAVYRPDLYREAAAELGISAPAIDLKTEGTHRQEWTIPGTAGVLRMGSDAFCDGRTFDPDEVLSYLAASEIGLPDLSLDALAALNP